ncbi:hypothetical protein JOQ06_017164, partial [Pogonophryne albipinna]
PRRGVPSPAISPRPSARCEKLLRHAWKSRPGYRWQRLAVCLSSELQMLQLSLRLNDSNREGTEMR